MPSLSKLLGAMALLTATTLAACGGSKAPQAPTAPPASPSSPAAPPSAGSSTSASPDAARPERKKLDGPVDPATVVARIALPTGERGITYAEVQKWAEAQRAAGESIRWPTTFDDLAGRILLAAEATQSGMTEPADEIARGEAWARQELAPTAKASITEADLQAAFSDRRSAVRIMSRSEAEAKELRATLAGQVAAATTMADKVKTFRSRGGKVVAPERQRDDATVAPLGALFDKGGKGDAGQAVVPPKVAETAFALAAEGDISEPIEIATGRFALVMLTGMRPGTPLDKVPPEVRQKAEDGLVAARAMSAFKERVARLRRQWRVTVLDDHAAQKALGLTAEEMRASRIRKLPFDTRKMRLDQVRGELPERIPGVEPRNPPSLEQATPDKALKGGPE